ncbi:MAG TPA: alpha/beta fold hydrolase [bacterium]|nr:alpha/beta fold hydrolase [bacterium]
MPFLESDYVPPPFFNNGHVQTVFAKVGRIVGGVRYRRERIATPDRDFLDLDWSRAGSRPAKRLAILSHGLEGASSRPYVLGMVRALNRRGWDALAWNLRGCSGELNKLVRSYHSGSTDDLEAVIAHVLKKYRYRGLALIGFSLGGNLTLKYLGEKGAGLDPRVQRAVAFSVPCHLKSTALRLSALPNKLYLALFLASLTSKMRAKRKVLAGRVPPGNLWTVTSFREFDDRFTAPINGFKDAEDYWKRSSCEGFLSGIRIPALVVNARDDPFLTGRSYPREKARESRNLFLEIPESGGHVGFVAFNRLGEYWSETRAASFLESS